MRTDKTAWHWSTQNRRLWRMYNWKRYTMVQVHPPKPSFFSTTFKLQEEASSSRLKGFQTTTVREAAESHHHIQYMWKQLPYVQLHPHRRLSRRLSAGQSMANDALKLPATLWTGTSTSLEWHEDYDLALRAFPRFTNAAFHSTAQRSFSRNVGVEQSIL